MTEVDAAAARYARVQAVMARHGVGALCVATPHLATFAAGARRVQVAGSGGTTPWVVVLAGAPAAFVFTTDPDGTPAWMPRAHVEPLRWDRVRQLARIADLVAGTSGTVACDVVAPALRDVLQGRELVDAAPVIAEATAPRTAGEIAAIGRALAAARAALGAATGVLAPGATSSTVLAALSRAMSPAGARFPLFEAIVRRDGVRLGSQDSFRDGDVIGVDVGLVLDGHAGVVADTVGCGRADVTAARRSWFRALCAIAKRCRAGTSLAALRDAAVDARATSDDGLLAHGLGVGIEDPLVDGDGGDQTLRAGTVLVLAPRLGVFRASRALVVTDGAPRWLEPAP